MGALVQLAEDGVVADYCVLRNPPDLIITDVDMPHMNGFEMIAALRPDVTLPRFPAIFLTTEEESEIQGRALGAIDYVAKPIRADMLPALVTANVPGERIVLG